ncbi:hypothetical protein AWC38_SpisGene5322 [Stylophora pistillata]|uniref:Uncharacterized protein n=1 Tax=Stylophora pistillata TaxID=50429 RepID=A0A2B4SL87_STYPI|nr:hypothetical protein AWC38_SpisGene5322 [Stylophora pistillata]
MVCSNVFVALKKKADQQEFVFTASCLSKSPQGCNEEAKAKCKEDWGLGGKIHIMKRTTVQRDTVKTCYEATYGERLVELVSESLLLINAVLALGKVPGRMPESVSHKETCFFSSLRLHEPSGEAKIAELLDERRTLVEAKLCKVTSVADVI